MHSADIISTYRVNCEQMSSKRVIFLVQHLFFVFLKEIFPKKKKMLCEKSRYFFLSFFMSELALHVRTLNLHTVGPHDL